MEVKNYSLQAWIRKVSPLFLMLLFVNLGWGQTAQILDYTMPNNANRAYLVSDNGWSQTGIGTDYSSPGSYIKFDTSGDNATLYIASAPSTVQYNLKGNSLSGSYVFQLSESADGATFTLVQSITSGIGTANTVFQSNLLTTTRYLKWTYVTKASGNIGFGGVVVNRVQNVVPVATNVTFSGLLNTTQTLTGNYEYSDMDSDVEGVSVLQWYTATDASGVDKTAIAGANLSTYVLSVNELNKFISFGVTPVASTGELIGVEVLSTWAGPVLAAGTPVLSVGLLTDFPPTCLNVTSALNSFTLLGNNLNSDITIGPLQGFSFSATENGTYTSSLILSPISEEINTTIYVKFTPTAVQSYNGNITVSGGGAATVDVSVVASGINTAVLTTSGTASAFTATSAVLAGSLTLGCSNIITYGFEYSTTNNFTAGSGITIVATDLSLGNYTAALLGLQSNTTYYYKAFATDATGTVYGVQNTFTTLPLTAPLAIAANAIGQTGFTANWQAVAGATGYVLDVYEKVDNSLYLITVVGWDFNDENITADSGLSANNNRVISTNATGLSFTNPAGAEGYIATTSGGWNSGSGSKNWQISFTTLNVNNIKMSSLQRSSNTGPRDFKVQYSLDNTVWTDIATSIVTVANDYTTGALTNITLPAVCENRSIVYLRWVMTSNTSVNNAVVAAGGTSAIDDILIKGDFVSISNEYFVSNLNVGNVTSYAVTGLNPNKAYFYVVRATDGGVSENSNEIAVTTFPPTSALWNGTSWVSNFPPTATIDAVIDGDYTITTNITAKDLTINLGKTLRVKSGNTLTVSGNLTNNGSIIFESDATGTGSFAAYNGTAVAGPVTVERFIPAKRAWRMLTAPLKGTTNNTIAANWQGTNGEGLLLFSPATYQSQTMTGYTTGGVAPNIWKYNGGWQSIANVSSESIYDAMHTKPFLVFATGAFDSPNVATGASATTLRPTGALITGTVTHNALAANVFHALANPYASAISTSSLIANNPGQKLWLLDPSLGTVGGYKAYDGTNWVPTPPTGNDLNIQSGQGFFVSSATASNFVINEADKVSGSSNTWFERNTVTSEANKDKIRVLLYKQDATQWQLADGILAVNYAAGTNGVDAMDTPKISNFNESIMFRNEATNLAISHNALPVDGTVQPIRMTGTSVMAYELHVRAENYTNSTLIPVLEDTTTGSFRAIPSDGTELVVPFTGMVSNATTPDNRFRIVYQSTLGTATVYGLVVNVFPNPVVNKQFNVHLGANTTTAAYTITNLLGQTIQKGALANTQNVITINTESQGVYILNVSQEGMSYTTKIYVQ